MLVQDWRPYQPCDAAKMHIYSPDSEDCLLFHYEFTGMVKLDQVVCKLRTEGSISYVDDDFHLEIDEAIYHQCVIELSQIPRKEPSTETAFRDKNSASTSRGRSLTKASTQISPVKYGIIVKSSRVKWLNMQGRGVQRMLTPTEHFVKFPDSSQVPIYTPG